MDVTKQGIFLIRECVDKDIGPAVIVKILEVNAHARKGLTLVVICNSRREPDFLERSVPLVSEELLGKRIVGDHDIGPAIPIKIVERDPQAFAQRVADP